MKLVALLCPTCKQPLSATNEEIVVLCAHCQAVVSLTDAGIALQPITYIAPRPNLTIGMWLPFWVCKGEVVFQRRVKQSGQSADRQADQFWQHAHHFFVPAWRLTTASVKKMATDLIREQPNYQPTDPPEHLSLASVVFDPEDVFKLLDLIVVTIEAQRSDMLKELAFELKLSPPELWAIPSSGDRQPTLLANTYE